MESKKMNISTGVKIVLSGAVASFALLTLTPTASFANTSREVVTPNQSVRAISQRTTPTNRMPQQPEQTGCKCCQAMMNHKPGMTNNQDSPSK